MTQKAEEAVDMAPDPEEDDLDDLDDVLDEFSAKPKSSSRPTTSTTAPTASGPGRPSESAVDETPAPPSEEDFAKQLQAGMENLMSELDDNPGMKKQFEDMMQELIAAGAAPTDAEAAEHVRNASDHVPKEPMDKSTAAGPAGGKKEDSFQDTIRKTMERMQQSGDAATAASSAPGGGSSEEEMLAELMKGLGGGEGGEEDFNKMLMSMMTQLTNKEILYEPMKELHDKFPDWMEKNKEKVDGADMARYEEQQRLVAEIVGRFERKGYSDSNEDDREYIVERMQKMQAAGSPPPDLVGDMSAAQEALGDMDAGCPTQ